MPVHNVHCRDWACQAARVGGLIDSLASEGDLLWPGGAGADKAWPRMKLDRPLAVGAQGGHGPIRYRVEEYVPGRLVRFRFSAPRGFHGFHCLEVFEPAEGRAGLKHTLAMTTSGWALITWPLIFRPLHDALIEDALSKAESSLGLPRQYRDWSPWVKGLRWLLAASRRKRPGAAGRANK